MAIKPFIYFLLILSIVFLIITVVFNQIAPTPTKNIPLVTFTNATMYDINKSNVTQLIQTKKAFIYKKKEELYDATVIIKSQNKHSKSTMDSLHADFIVVTKDLLKFSGNVKYNRDSTTTLHSKALTYDKIKKQIIGKEKFVAYHDGNKLTGSSLTIQKDKTVFKSTDNTPVKLDIVIDKKKDLK